MINEQITHSSRELIQEETNLPLQIGGQLKQDIEELAQAMGKNVGDTLGIAIGVFLTAKDKKGEVRAFDANGKQFWSSGKIGG